jgi:CO/xanthine dehydrogenase FAD-binding subunit
MKPVDFRYVRPLTAAEAIGALAGASGDATIIAGGQSLGPMLNMRLVAPSLLVDVNAIPELRTIEETGDAIRFGATVRQREAERSALVARRLPLMRDALPHIGHTQTRNRGTVVGSIVHAHPAAELPLVALCLDAVVEIEGPAGAREVAIADFYHGYYETALGSDELALAVRFPAPALPSGVCRGTAFLEMSRRASDFALVGAAAQIDVDVRARRVTDVRLGLLGVAETPFRFRAGEALVCAASDPPAAFASVGRAAAEAIDPDTDLHATAAYRRSVAATLLERVLDAAWLHALVAEPRI